jgi:hypothetical protein
LRLLPTEGKLAGQKWLASIQGRIQGWQTWQQHYKTKNFSTNYLHPGDVQ